MDMYKMTPWNWLRRKAAVNATPQRQPGHPLLRWERVDNWFEQMLATRYDHPPPRRAQHSYITWIFSNVTITT